MKDSPGFLANVHKKRKISMSTMQEAQSRPNHDLTLEEKEAKRRLKRHLKQRTKLRKYQVRLQQATIRKDEALMARAGQEVDDYIALLKEETTSVWYEPDFQVHWKKQQRPQTNAGMDTNADSQGAGTKRWTSEEKVEFGRKWMTKHIWQKLIVQITETAPLVSPSMHPATSTADKSRQPTSSLPTITRKQQQTNEARTLLSHMTKGTQEESMFENDAAIIGYTRQKFMERALLALKSLCRLQEHVETYETQESEPGHARKLLDQLRQTSQIISIGCGPGCDAVGALTFLVQQQNPRTEHEWQREQSGNEDNTPSKAKLPAVHRIVFLDYVMPQWKRLVLDALLPLLTRPNLCTHVETAACDVRQNLVSLSSSSKIGADDLTDATDSCRNEDAWKLLRASNRDSEGGGRLIVVSYLLTETREQWSDFFRDLLNECYGATKPSVLLMSEPTAWQLHRFLSYFDDEFLDGYQWLDSSMEFPELQPLEGRLGPAVLLVQTKCRSVANGS